jgi:legumain
MKLAILLSLVAFASAAHWALLIAGSNGYGNYRHQSDICHAYHILHDKGGIPEDHIVVMMYDDIANSPSNPFKGNIINKPDGPNVYPGVPHDYVGTNVNKQQFLAALSGDDQTTHGRKVIKSTSEDEIFVYYSDHGGSGLIAMPSGGYLYANELNDVLKKMAAQRKFKKFTFYLEACESGSMFSGILPKDINIYATTAANPSESSYAYYYDSSRRTYLGDEYSIRWMEDADVASFKEETLQIQFENVRNLTKMSHVMQYGDVSLAQETLSEYMEEDQHRGRWTGPLNFPHWGGDAVDSRDVALFTLIHQFENSNDVAEKLFLSKQIALEKGARVLADIRFENLWTAVAGNRLMDAKLPANTASWFCYQESVEAFESACGRLSDYALKHTRVLATLCADGFSPLAIAKAASEICA